MTFLYIKWSSVNIPGDNTQARYIYTPNLLFIHTDNKCLHQVTMFIFNPFVNL